MNTELMNINTVFSSRRPAGDGQGMELQPKRQWQADADASAGGIRGDHAEVNHYDQPLFCGTLSQRRGHATRLRLCVCVCVARTESRDEAWALDHAARPEPH